MGLICLINSTNETRLPRFGSYNDIITFLEKTIKTLRENTAHSEAVVTSEPELSYISGFYSIKETFKLNEVQDKINIAQATDFINGCLKKKSRKGNDPNLFNEFIQNIFHNISFQQYSYYVFVLRLVFL